MNTNSIQIPLIDLKRQNVEIQNELKTAISKVIDDNSFSLGSFVEKFENSFAKYCDVNYCVALNSGTSALHLALKTYDIGPGDEVITVPMTFMGLIYNPTKLLDFDSLSAF